MPKIRKKQHLKIDGVYREKSGLLSRSIRNIIKKNKSSNSYFKSINLHNNNPVDIDTIPYNDDNTHVFVEKLVNPVLSVEDVYKTSSKVLHTPNEFDTNNKITRLVVARDYNMLVEDNHLSVTKDFSMWKDNNILSKEDLIGNKSSIDIDLDFENPCRLSLNKPKFGDITEYNTVTFGSDSFNPINSPIVYFNFQDNEWEYLGDVESSNSFDIDHNDNIIAFNSIRTRKSIQDSDVIIVKFGEKYKQWNAAFDAGYAAALNKSIIVIHSEDHQHALKEVDAAAAAVAPDQIQAVRILKYVLQGTLK